MAYPTQITISAGKTVYEGDQSDGITSRQVQVSVTYQLERADDDLLQVTARKAKEVEAAQAAVWRQVRREQTEMELPPGDQGPHLPTDEDDPLGGQGSQDEDWPGDGSEDDDPPFYGGGEEGHGEEPADGGGIAPPYHPAASQGVNPQGTRPQGLHSCRTGPGNGYGNGHQIENGHHPPAPGGSPTAERLPQSIRKPQKLAIEAQARRLGLSDQALAATIRERFGKESYTPRFAVDKLTKAEADALLRALQATGHGDDRPMRPGQAMPA